MITALLAPLSSNRLKDIEKGEKNILLALLSFLSLPSHPASRAHVTRHARCKPSYLPGSPLLPTFSC